jgi:hypothetical protein
MYYDVSFGQWDHFNISHECQYLKKLLEFEILKILKLETLHFTRDAQMLL